MEEPSQKDQVVILDSQNDIELYRKLCALDMQLIGSKGRENDCIILGRVDVDEELILARQAIAEYSREIRRIEKELAEKYGYGKTIGVSNSERKLHDKEYFDQAES